MNPVAGFLFSSVVVSVLYINKYVLSILGFRYPTIFQGWQTLTGLVIYKLLTIVSKSGFKVTTIDRSALISLLPGFLFYTTSIISSSKALAGVPIPIFVSVFNILPALIYLLDRLLPKSGAPPTSVLQVCSSIMTLCTGSILVLSQISLNFGDSAYFWLVVGVVCTAAYCLHCRISDARYTSWDKLYYNSVFSVIVLAPASFYLEEAFEALHFHHDRQELFLFGCFASAVLGATANLYSVRLKQDEYFGPVHHLALGTGALISPMIFTEELPVWKWILVVINVVSSLTLPSHVKQDEDEANFPGLVQNF